MSLKKMEVTAVQKTNKFAELHCMGCSGEMQIINLYAVYM